MDPEICYLLYIGLVQQSPVTVRQHGACSLFSILIVGDFIASVGRSMVILASYEAIAHVSHCAFEGLLVRDVATGFGDGGRA